MFPARLFRCATLLLACACPLAFAQTNTQPAEAVLHRIMPHLAPQFHLTLHPNQPDAFHITGTPGNIQIDAATTPTLLYGVNWYLKYVAHLQISTNGLQLGPANLILPAPPQPITQPALYKIRYALNENADGYSAPYWSDARWQHEIDILALSGTNAILIERGADLVLYQTFRDAGYSDLAIRRWITQPAHQNWQLMGNMCCFIEPISLGLLHKRAASAQRIIASLRALGITPVLPGYYGIVPADFATLHPNAHVKPQGDWNGFTRPGWIDPRNPSFAKLAADFYYHQRQLFGDTTLYDMEIFQEGGDSGNVPPGPAAQLIQTALEAAHPNALWFLMAWQDNPLPAIMQSLDTRHVLVADIEQGRIPRNHRDRQFHGADWLFGGLWEFGGRTTLGAPLYDYAVRFPTLAALPHSHITGTALFTEGLDTNPFAFDLYTEMAWHKDPVDLNTWTDDYASRRYGSLTPDGKPDPHAQRAWQILLHTAYSYRADGGKGERDAAHDSLFDAQPSLTTQHAATWSPDNAHYALTDLNPALTELLQVSPSLRSTETYQYDLVDIARQVMENQSRIMLPQIAAAYNTGDRAAFVALTRHWLRRMQLLDNLLRTNQYFLLGRWLSYVTPWASSPAELQQLNYDARSILTTWGDRHASEAGLHEYANRDYAGLTADYYAPRWHLYFSSLLHSLDAMSSPPDAQPPIDWYAFGDAWNHKQTTYPATPTGNSYAAAMAIANDLDLAPPQPSKP
jgi:alpha-N-acetylglucosaminidase